MLPSARQVVLFGRPRWAAGSDLWRDFSRGAGNLPDPTDTHAASILADDLAGAYSSFGANALVRTNRGLQTVPTRVELGRFTKSLTAGAWTKTDTVDTPVAGSPHSDGTGAVRVVQGPAANASFQMNGPSASPMAAVTNYVHSRWLKYDGTRWVMLSVSDNVANGFRVWVDLLNNVLGSTAAFGTGTVGTPMLEIGPNGWVRVVVIGQVPAGSGSTDWSASSICVSANSSTTRIAGQYLLYGANFQQGSFAVPAIINETNASVTVAGNQQVITGLGTQLANGVYGFVQVDVRGLRTNDRVITFDDGTGNNNFHIRQNGGAWRATGTVGGVGLSGITFGVDATGLSTFAFALGPNFEQVRRVGDAANVAVTSITYPAMTQIGFGGAGYTNLVNSFQNTRKLALWFGAPGAAQFDQAFAAATLAAAA